MPIGAAIGGAAIAGVATVGAGAMGASAQRSAANTAADTSLATTNANNQLFRETRAQNLQIASPLYNNGLAAGNALSDLLLGTHTYNPAVTSNPTVPGGGTFPTTGAGSGAGALSDYTGPDLAGIEALRHDGIPGNHDTAMAAYRAAQGSGALSNMPTATTPAATTPAATDTTTTGGVTTTPSALSAWDQFRGGTNYNWRLGEGLKAVNSSAAARGMSDSGAAMKSLVTYGQNFASNELSNYMNLLAGQQNVGLSAGNAVMGVGTAAANAIAGQNSQAGSVAANAALASGQANANMWGSVGQGVGQIGGALTQYGMSRMPTPQMPTPSYAPPPVNIGYSTPSTLTAPTYSLPGFG